MQTRIDASTTRYEYNGDGDRVAETVNGTRTLFTLDVASSLTNVLVETTPVKNDQNQTIIQTVSYTYGLGPVAQSGGSSMGRPCRFVHFNNRLSCGYWVWS